MENLSGFSYLLPKSGSRSQMKRLFFVALPGVKSEFSGVEPVN